MANILVCDDDKDIVEAISIYLEQEGYTVLKAYDGVEAISALRSQSVDLLIIDIMMPKLDGIRATLKIREEMFISLESRVSDFMLPVWASLTAAYTARKPSSQELILTVVRGGSMLTEDGESSKPMTDMVSPMRIPLDLSSV